MPLRRCIAHAGAELAGIGRGAVQQSDSSRLLNRAHWTLLRHSKFILNDIDSLHRTFQLPRILS